MVLFRTKSDPKNTDFCLFCGLQNSNQLYAKRYIANAILVSEKLFVEHRGSLEIRGVKVAKFAILSKHKQKVKTSLITMGF